ncbi:MAG TPA: hypothetical protein VJ201_06695 [Candidatus Babeliales bacterium]|nr:hypothetical protein [Candidatus Babeliales bacterium]
MNNKFNSWLVVMIFISVNNSMFYPFTINRAIMASDTNPTYIDFWPLVSQAWVKLIGIRPTLALISEKKIPVDTTYGDVIYFYPIPGVSTALQSQTIRLLLPALFPDEISIISDIDMLPINKEYFINSVREIPQDKFVVYRDRGYKPPHNNRFPMCYNAGKGILFKEIFGVNSIDDIPKIIKKWNTTGYGWITDEMMLYQHLLSWKKYATHCVKLGHEVGPRIDRISWVYSPEKLVEKYYIDSHLLRPLNNYRKEISQISQILGLKIT